MARDTGWVALGRTAERCWAAAMAAVAVCLQFDVAVHDRAGWWWLLAAVVLAGQVLLVRQVRARLPTDEWRPVTYWIGHLATTTSAVTAVTVAFGPPRGVDAVVMGLLAGPVLSILRFAISPRVGPSTLGP